MFSHRNDLIKNHRREFLQVYLICFFFIILATCFSDYMFGLSFISVDELSLLSHKASSFIWPLKCITYGLINFIIQIILSSLSYHASYFLYSSSISGPQFPLQILPNFSPSVSLLLWTSTPSLFSSYFHLKHSKTLLPISSTSKLGHQWTQFCQIQWSTLAIHCISAISHVRVFPFFATWNHTTIISHSDYYTNYQLVSLRPHFPHCS